METRAATAVDALALSRGPELISIVGGGGKSSLMFALAESLPGRVVATTTTRIFAAQMNRAAEVCNVQDPNWREQLNTFTSNLLVVSGTEGERAVGVSPELVPELLRHARVDWVVVEADGSRMLPVKAPAEHEPVIPPQTSLLVIVVGIDALARPLRDVAHRPERVAAITGLALDATLTPETLALLLTSPRGGFKRVPDGARVAVLINKVETSAQVCSARDIARCALAREPRVERVMLGAFRLANGWEVLQR